MTSEDLLQSERDDALLELEKTQAERDALKAEVDSLRAQLAAVCKLVNDAMSDLKAIDAR